MTTDDFQPQGEYPAVSPPWARYHNHGAVDDCTPGCPANEYGFTIEDPSAFIATKEVVGQRDTLLAARYMTVDPPVVGEDDPPGRRVYTIADIEAMRAVIDAERRLAAARRQAGYPRGHRADFVEMGGCRIPRPQPRVFDRRISGDTLMLALALVAVGAIAAYIIIAAVQS